MKNQHENQQVVLGTGNSPRHFSESPPRHPKAIQDFPEITAVKMSTLYPSLVLQQGLSHGGAELYPAVGLWVQKCSSDKTHTHTKCSEKIKLKKYTTLLWLSQTYKIN